jgi:hypothetical protein
VFIANKDATGIACQISADIVQGSAASFANVEMYQ